MNIILHILITASLAVVQECPIKDIPKTANGKYDMGGALIGEFNGRKYSIHRVCDRRIHKLLLKRLTGHLYDGQPIWETRAEMRIPVGKKKYTFAYGLNSCRQRGQFNSELIGLIDWTQNKEYPQAIKAWLVDLEREQFREIKATDVECENVSYGI
jgi:hypothetical protein